MKITKEVLLSFMVQDAIRKHQELKILDKAAMMFELRNAVTWYEGVTP